MNYRIEDERFYFYATNYYTSLINTRLKNNFEFNIKDNSVLFIGQSYKDVSIKKDNKFLNILDFKDRLNEFSKKYIKIYYLEDLYNQNKANFNKKVENYIQSTSYIEKINILTHYLLASNKIKKVVSISLSVLFEVQFFKKEIEYLFQALFDFNLKFSLNSFIHVYNDYFNPRFWSDILSPIINTIKNVLNKNLFYENINKLRNIDQYYGYKYLDRLSLLENTINNPTSQFTNTYQ